MLHLQQYQAKPRSFAVRQTSLKKALAFASAFFWWRRVDWRVRAPIKQSPGLFYLPAGNRRCPHLNLLDQNKKRPVWNYGSFFIGGGGWIRTTEVERQQIYSLPPLAARELLHIAGAGNRT